MGKNDKHLYASDSARVVSSDVEYLEIRYRFQKNKDIGQKIKYSRPSSLTICPVRAGLRIRRRDQRLNVPSDTPITSVAKSLYNLTNLEDIRRFSSHSFRDGACVLLHSSGKD
eukprot:8860501-Ditylum_brightwellii.AAC.1